MAIAREWINTGEWFDIKRGRRPNTITFLALSLHWLWVLRRRYTIEYEGGLDEDFRPHGFGIWKDSSYHGEMLVGAWEHGIPVGPFTSREHGTGYASQQICVAYASYRTEDRPDQRYFVPKCPKEKAIQWGVASVECSVAGGFFTFLPRVQHITSRENAPRSASECVTTLRTPLDDVCYHDTETEEFRGKHTIPENKARGQPKDREKEALVFIHGVDNALDDAIMLCGHLLARGDFPSEIHPFVFSWPSGNFPFPLYWTTRTCAESDNVAWALQTFVASLLEAGYTKVNFVTHSMGTRVFLNTVERNKFKSLFQNGSFEAHASMSTVTLCSPEFPLGRFVAAGGTFDVLREYCSHVTIYGDESDLALRGSELCNRDWKLCSPLVKSLGCNVQSAVREASFRPPKDAVEAPASVSSSTRAATTCDTSDEAYDDDDANINAETPRVHLDVDVINTSFTDTNIGNARHSYFQVNESIVEDIRDQILHKRRARGRAGLMRLRDNAFIFITAPKDIL